jgi:hypothetical protein
MKRTTYTLQVKRQERKTFTGRENQENRAGVFILIITDREKKVESKKGKE